MYKRIQLQNTYEKIAAISEYLNRDRFGTEKVQYNSAA